MSCYIYLLVCPFFYYLPFSPTIALENNNYLTLILLPAKLSVLATLNFFETSFFGTPCPCFVHYFHCLLGTFVYLVLLFGTPCPCFVHYFHCYITSLFCTLLPLFLRCCTAYILMVKNQTPTIKHKTNLAFCQQMV